MSMSVTPLRRWDTPLPPVRQNTTLTSKVISTGLIFLVIFVLVPWQVAFLGCWVYQLYVCATFSSRRMEENTTGNAIPLKSLSLNSSGDETDKPKPTPTLATSDDDQEQRSHSPSASSYTHAHALLRTNYVRSNEYLLLLMTWLLPLVAPVLAVWVRTLATAGVTSPFDGDHNVLYVVPFLGVVEGGWGVVQSR